MSNIFSINRIGQNSDGCFFQMSFALITPSLLNDHAGNDEDSEEKFELVTGRDEETYASCEDLSDAPQDVGIECSAEDGQSREDLNQADGRLTRHRVIVEDIRSA